jgi:SAM-dependent methyltransferase
MTNHYTLAQDEQSVMRLRAMADSAIGFERPAWRDAGVGPGSRVLEVGCGPGALLGELAMLVGAAGEAVGIDTSAEAISEARSYLRRRGLSQARVEVADGFDSGLEPESFDSAYLRLVLVHVGERATELLRAVRELVRPGGTIVLSDGDHASTGISGDVPEFEELMNAWKAMMSHRGNDVRIGLHLPRIAADAGLQVVAFRGHMNIIEPDVTFRMPHWEARKAIVTDETATAADLRRWEPLVEHYAASRPFYTCFPSYTVIARRL